MIAPKLVEHNIKDIIYFKLNECHQLKSKYYNFIYNSLCFFGLFGIISTTLYFKYKSKTPQEMLKKEVKKRDYILYNLRKYQNIKNSHITNIPQI